jgi:hypothetical protein
MQSWMPLKTVFSLALLAGLTAALPAQAADVGVSIGISQPGVYGRIDIGRFPQPQLIVQQPVIIHRPPVYVAAPPIYLWVPPGHQKNWRNYCSRYNACGQPVYFVQDNWYRERGPGREVNHGYREGRRDDRGYGDRDQEDDRGRGHGKDKDKDHDKWHGKGGRD